MAEVLRDTSNIDDVMDLVFDSYSRDGIISRVDVAGEVKNDEVVQSEELYIIDHEQRGRVNFYKNSITHMTLPVNMISLAVLITAADKKTSKSRITAEFERIRDALSKEFIYPDLLNDTDLVIENTLSHFVSEGIIKIEGKDVVFDESGDEMLKFFAGMIQDYIESYLIVLNTIADFRVKDVSRKDFTIAVRKHGTRMYHLSEIQCSESLSTINYNNAIDKFIDAGILKQYGEAKKLQLTILESGRAESLKTIISGYLDKVRSN
jgi:glycerol-3-phosphate O-acyltransferase